MQAIIVICLAIAAVQAAPAEEYQSQFQGAISNTQFKPMFQDAAEEAKQNADQFMQQYQGVSKDIKNTLAEFPDQVFTKTFKTTAEKIKSYSQSLQPMLQDPNSSPEDKAHQVISSITPLLDGIISDFQNAADDVESYLADANPVVQDGATNMADSTNNVIQKLVNSLQKYTAQAKPEVNNIFDAANSDLVGQEGTFKKQLADNLGSLQEQINQYQPQDIQIPQIQY